MWPEGLIRSKIGLGSIPRATTGLQQASKVTSDSTFWSPYGGVEYHGVPKEWVCQRQLWNYSIHLGPPWSIRQNFWGLTHTSRRFSWNLQFQGDLRQWIQGGWSLGDWSERFFSPDQSLESISWVPVAWKPSSEIIWDSDIRGSCASSAIKSCTSHLYTDIPSKILQSNQKSTHILWPPPASGGTQFILIIQHISFSHHVCIKTDCQQKHTTGLFLTNKSS